MISLSWNPVIAHLPLAKSLLALAGAVIVTLEFLLCLESKSLQDPINGQHP
jgi:hypothetical protein